MSYTGKELVEVIKQQPISIFTEIGPSHMDIIKVSVKKRIKKFTGVRVVFKDSNTFDFYSKGEKDIDLDYILSKASNGVVNILDNLINIREIKFITCNYEDSTEYVCDYYMKDYGFKLEWCDETDSFDIV